MKKILLLLRFTSLIGLLLCIPSVAASAQTTATVQWNQSETPAVAQTFQYTFKLDAVAPVTLAASCVAVNSVTTCSAPLTSYVPGVHTIVLTASNNSGSASTTFTTSLSPTAPTGGKVIVIIIGD